MGEKLVIELVGIGEVLGGRFKDYGFDMVFFLKVFFSCDVFFVLWFNKYDKYVN